MTPPQGEEAGRGVSVAVGVVGRCEGVGVSGQERRRGARAPSVFTPWAPGTGDCVGALSRFCMLLLKASYCISFCLSLPTCKMGLLPPTSSSLQGSTAQPGRGTSRSRSMARVCCGQEDAALHCSPAQGACGGALGHSPSPSSSQRGPRAARSQVVPQASGQSSGSHGRGPVVRDTGVLQGCPR